MFLPLDYRDLLAHPVSKKPLIQSDGADELTEPESGDQFAINDGIPNLLPKSSSWTQLTFDYAAHYDEDARVYDYFDPPEGKTELAERLRLHEMIGAQLGAKRGWVLDAGCGGGWLAEALLPKGYSVISADITGINPAKALKAFPSPNHFGLVADANFLPIKANSLDCIVASEIMEHVPDPGAFTASLYAALKPGGKLIITTPYNEFIRYSLCIHCNRNTPHNAHLHSFTEKSVMKFLPPDAVDIRISIFGSKALSMFRLLPMLKWLPASPYRILDKALISLSRKKASRLIVAITKS